MSQLELVCHSAVKILAAMSSSNQSTPVSKFSPVTALQPMMHQWWLLISSRASACRRTAMIKVTLLVITWKVI